MSIEIWEDPTVDRLSEGCCVIEDSHEERFIRAVAEEMVEILGINWKNKEVTTSLIQSGIREKMYDFLKQYLNSQIQILGETFNREFDISVHPEYSYATHAKLDTHIQQIKEHFQRIKMPVRNLPECEAETLGRLKPKRRE